MDHNNYYPLKFTSRFHEKIWGGDRIFSYKKMQQTHSSIGESWEISPMAGDISVIANGPRKGTDLNTYISEEGTQVLGKHVKENFGELFPLLIKIIDANDHLSIQVHPQDDYALKHHASKGKTEMWYVLECQEDSLIYVGWKKDVEPSELTKIIDSGEVMNYLQSYPVKSGDAFFIPAGTVHAIGKGCLIMEIQEASDITYRLYDYKRTDSMGRERELHIDESAHVLNYSATGTEYIPKKSSSEEEFSEILVDCKYFRTSLLQFAKHKELDLSSRDSFTVLFCIEGEILIEGDFSPVTLQKGETALLPAAISSCSLTSQTSRAKLIESYVP